MRARRAKCHETFFVVSMTSASSRRKWLWNNFSHRAAGSGTISVFSSIDLSRIKPARPLG